MQIDGVYGGYMNYDSSPIAAFAFDVTATGNQFSGVSCFLFVDGSEACPDVAGNTSGSNVTFQIGSITFSGSGSHSSISGTYTFSEGSGTWNLERDDELSAQAVLKLSQAPTSLKEALLK